MFIFGVCMLTLGSVLPYLDRHLMLNEMEKGSLASLLPLGILAGSLIFGPVADRYSYRFLLFISGMVTSAGIILAGLSDGITGLLASFFLIGLGGGSLNGTTSALISDLSPEGSSQRGANLSLLGVFFGLGALGTPLLFGSVPAHGDYRQVLFWIGGSMLLPALYFLWVRYPAAKRVAGTGTLSWRVLWSRKLLLLIGAVLFMQSGLESMVNNWITSYYTLHGGLTTKASLTLLTLFVVVFTLSRFLLRYLLVLIPAVRIMWAAAGLIAAGSLVMIWGTGRAGVYLSIASLGLGLAAGFPVMLGIVGEEYRNWSGTAFSMVFAISVIGNSLINLGVGWVTERAGIGMLPLLMTGCVIIYSLLLYNTFHTINSPKNLSK